MNARKSKFKVKGNILNQQYALIEYKNQGHFTKPACHL